MGDFANGAIFCQLIDVIYEGKAELNKVDWVTDSDANYSLLKQIMDKFKITREIDVGFFQLIFEFWSGRLTSNRAKN